MIKVKSWLFIIQTVLIIISIPPSYATTSIEDGIEYASTILKSRLQYFNSLKNFVSNPENTFSDKMTLIGSVTSENYYQKLKKALDPLPEKLRDQEFQKIIKNFIDDIENSPLSVYSILVEIFSFELDFIKGTQELISAKNLVTDGTKILRERYSELNWEGIDKRAKLIACYSYLVVIHEFFCLQRVFRDLEPILLLDFEFEVTEVKAEFYRTELKIIEDLKNYLLTLMSKKDREFVEHFEVVRKLDKSTGIRSFGVSDKNSLLEKYKSYWNSYKKLGYEFQILNYEFFRINKKINKKLSVREVAKSLTSVPELIDLSETPVEEPSEIMNYFLTSTTPNLVSKLEYLRSNIVLNPFSQQKLVELLQAIPSRESSVRVALTCNYDFKNNPLFKEIYDYFDQLKSLFENDPSHTNITRRRLFGETAFLESYVTNIHSFLLNEAAQFNTELAQEISSFTELLKSFDENGIRGTKQQFKVIKKVSPSPVPSGDSHSEMNLSTSTLQVDTILASQSSVLKDRLIVEGSKEGLLEQESHQQLPPLSIRVQTVSGKLQLTNQSLDLSASIPSVNPPEELATNLI